MSSYTWLATRRDRPEWRFVLCDIDGHYLSDISGCALDKHFDFEHDGIVQCSFKVPSHDPRVNITHTDGDPYLNCGNRTLKCYRLNPVSGVWSIKANLYVDIVNDQSESDTVLYTHVTCNDPWGSILTQRLVCKADGDFHHPVQFPSQDLSQIAKTMIDRTNSIYGITGVTTTGGTFGTTTSLPYFSVKEYIADKLKALCATGLIDIWLDPVDRTDGIMAVMSTAAMRGADKPAAIFGVARDPYNVATYSRIVSTATLANDLTLYSSYAAGTVHDSEMHVTVNDIPSRTKYRRRQAIDVDFDAATIGLLTQFANTELLLRKQPRQIVSISPAPDFSSLPWDDYFLGDAVFVYASVDARQAIAGKQRVYGISLDIDNDGFERVSELKCTFDAG